MNIGFWYYLHFKKDCNAADANFGDKDGLGNY